MNKLTRAITLGGFGVLAALAVGTGPAQAAGTATATPESKTAASRADWRLDGEVVGYYPSLRSCEMAGRYGERAGAWDDHDCSPVRGGLRHGTWALEVGDDDNWGRFGFGRPFQVIRTFPGQFRPRFAGQFRPGRPSHIGHHHFGNGRPDVRPGRGPVRGGPQGQPGGVRDQHNNHGSQPGGVRDQHNNHGSQPGGVRDQHNNHGSQPGGVRDQHNNHGGQPGGVRGGNPGTPGGVRHP
ncbi:hypothetical protein [Paractinoplanes maris]|uniref:hypothetical protein n=1 Tax=Paractinoplanes maris TaxID=1734446 RepID=UPI002021D47F|nr:hypothetical protein [Actinoplanes maris]